MSAQENAKIAKATYEAFNNRTSKQWAADYATSDAKWVNVPLGMTLHGQAGFEQYVQGWLMAFPDGKVEVTNVVAGEDAVVTEFRGRGTHTGPLMGPAGEIPATGKTVDIAFCEVLQFKNGKAIGSRLYFDVATMMGQLGLMR